MSTDISNRKMVRSGTFRTNVAPGNKPGAASSMGLCPPRQGQFLLMQEIADNAVEFVGFLPLHPMPALGEHDEIGIRYLLLQNECRIHRHYPILATPNEQGLMR